MLVARRSLSTRVLPSFALSQQPRLPLILLATLLSSATGFDVRCLGFADTARLAITL